MKGTKNIEDGSGKMHIQRACTEASELCKFLHNFNDCNFS